MGFSLSHNDELNAFERGSAGADTPMSIQDFDVSLSIWNDALPMASRADKKRFGYKN